MRSVLLRWKKSLESRLTELESEVAEEFASAESCDPANAEALRKDEVLDSIVREIARQYPGRPLVAYGSRIAGNADAHSDLDVLVMEFDRNAAPVQGTTIAHGVEVDFARVGFNVLLRGLKGRARYNNNCFLSALRRCCIYGDQDGDARRLRIVAQRIWKAGPRTLTPKQLDAGRAGLLRNLHTAEKLSARAGDSAEAARLARISCDQLATQSLYLFYCVRGRWTTSLRRLVERCKGEYPELYALWLEYIESAEPEEALSAARRMVKAVHEGFISAQQG